MHFAFHSPHIVPPHEQNALIAATSSFPAGVNVYFLRGVLEPIHPSLDWYEISVILCCSFSFFQLCTKKTKIHEKGQKKELL